MSSVTFDVLPGASHSLTEAMASGYTDRVAAYLGTGTLDLTPPPQVLDVNQPTDITEPEL